MSNVISGSGISLIFLVVLCHGQPVALDLQDEPLSVLQEFLNGVEVEMDQLRELEPGLGGR